MSRIPSIKRNFGRRPDGKLIVLCETVIKAMTNNDNFTTPQPPLADLSAALADFIDAVAAAKKGGDEQQTLKEAAKAILAGLLDKEASYVELVADDDVAKLQSSGFELTKVPAPVGPLGPAKNFQMEAAGKGMLEFSVEKNSNAKGYQFEYRKVDETIWTIEVSTARKLVVQDLERGGEYVGRVLQFGASKIREYTQQLTAFVA